MREITEHRVDGDLPQNQLLVIAADERGGDPGITAIVFQNGGIKEAGLNGITYEVLLAILADRLRGIQDGPFSSLENGHALDCIEEVLDFLKIRTKSRIARGVEGEQKP